MVNRKIEELQAQIEAYQGKVDQYTDQGREDAAERYALEVQKLQRKLEKEEAKAPVHPALMFGPVSQTIASMAALSLGMSVSDLPYEMYPFYRLFSTITIFAVICLVTRSGIIYYEYTSIISSAPSLSSKEAYKEAQFKDWMKRMKEAARPDDWQNSRSHPSHFLTTRHAPPRMFPFPLGKTNTGASIKDELWWEGGNAPHVGHFNKPGTKIDFPRDVVSDKWLERAKKQLEIEEQQALWKRRIRSIQTLSVVVILSFISRKIANLLLIYLIYSTLSTEIDNILKPPNSLLKDLDEKAQSIQQAMKPEKPQKSKVFTNAVQGMGYVYSPDDIGKKGKGDKGNSSKIPIVHVAPSVLMTGVSSRLNGPGEVWTGEKNYSAR